jgi:hypothetical protein
MAKKIPLLKKKFTLQEILDILENLKIDPSYDHYNKALENATVRFKSDAKNK